MKILGNVPYQDGFPNIRTSPAPAPAPPPNINIFGISLVHEYREVISRTNRELVRYSLKLEAARGAYKARVGHGDPLGNRHANLSIAANIETTRRGIISAKPDNWLKSTRTCSAKKPIVAATSLRRADDATPRGRVRGGGVGGVGGVWREAHTCTRRRDALTLTH
jgi:hypothetical protein